jgi:hypothetical protein
VLIIRTAFEADKLLSRYSRIKTLFKISVTFKTCSAFLMQIMAFYMTGQGYFLAEDFRGNEFTGISAVAVLAGYRCGLH